MRTTIPLIWIFGPTIGAISESGIRISPDDDKLKGGWLSLRLRGEGRAIACISDRVRSVLRCGGCLELPDIDAYFIKYESESLKFVSPNLFGCGCNPKGKCRVFCMFHKHSHTLLPALIRRVRALNDKSGLSAFHAI